MSVGGQKKKAVVAHEVGASKTERRLIVYDRDTPVDGRSRCEAWAAIQIWRNVKQDIEAVTDGMWCSDRRCRRSGLLGRA